MKENRRNYIVVIIMIIVVIIGTYSFVLANDISSNSVNADINRFAESIKKEFIFISENTLLTDEEIVEDIAKLFMTVKNEDYINNEDILYDYMFFNDTKYINNQNFYHNTCELQKELRKASNNDIVWSNNFCEINTIKVEENFAELTLYNRFEFLQSNRESFTARGLNVNMKFIKYDNKWLITEITTDDEMYKSMDIKGFSVENKFNEMMTYTKPDPSINEEATKKDLEIQEYLNNIENSPYFNVQWTTYSLHRTNAAYYALVYDGSSRNSRFYDYSAEGDCQNFASQCVWYGFGGTNSAYSIDNKLFPMTATGGYRDWYCTSTYNNKTATWTAVIYFKSYLEAGGTNVVGVDGVVYNYDLSNAQKGDVIQIYNANNGWYHSYIVVNVTGTYGSRTNSDIYVSAHTNDRDNDQLFSIVGSSQSNLRLLVPALYREQ